MAKTAAVSTPIEALLKERRKFTPPKDFVKNANINRPSIYKEAARNPARFWEGWARQLQWFKPWKKALEWKLPYAKWFIGGKLNVSYNCLDRHVTGPRDGPRPRSSGKGEPGDTPHPHLLGPLPRGEPRSRPRSSGSGVRKGDRVTIYMPMVPELPIAMLACARIGAAHSVVFGGFSPEAAARPHPRRRVQAW